jgi:hypothetical protein
VNPESVASIVSVAPRRGAAKITNKRRKISTLIYNYQKYL